MVEFNNENNFVRKVITNIKVDVEKDINSEIFLIKDGKEGKIEMTINRNNIWLIITIFDKKI